MPHPSFDLSDGFTQGLDWLTVTCVKPSLICIVMPTNLIVCYCFGQLEHANIKKKGPQNGDLGPFALLVYFVSGGCHAPQTLTQVSPKKNMVEQWHAGFPAESQRVEKGQGS